MTIIVHTFISCGTTNTSDKNRNSQDSVKKADSISKIVPEVESWDLLLIALENEAGFNNKYGRKKIKIKNLVVDNITMEGKTIQCLAYSPIDSTISNTSQKGDAIKKVVEMRDYVNDVPCKINSDFTYFFDLHFTEIPDSSKMKLKQVKEGKLSRKSFFFTVITVEGESILFKENAFSLNNCKILNK